MLDGTAVFDLQQWVRVRGAFHKNSFQQGFRGLRDVVTAGLVNCFHGVISGRIIIGQLGPEVEWVPQSREGVVEGGVGLADRVAVEKEIRWTGMD